ncbi:hypothetical protein [Thalassobellus sediminis]|uniref:hypothetical protein n=1 Tax=Thalassobellus sediminis TaxID=3367753 RepID=UPI0037BAC5A7
MNATKIKWFVFFGLLISVFSLSSCEKEEHKKTVVAIKGEQFYINDEITYKNRNWEGNKIEGLLFNSRMVQGVFDDLNPDTRDNFKYPDTQVWDPERNTNEFIAAMPDWKSHGLLAFTLNLQGGSPLGYGNYGWVNTAFDSIGNLRPKYINRLEKILDKADDIGMVVILGYFYFGQDDQLKDEQAVLNAVDNITNWLLKKSYSNLLIEINNECDINYEHKILQPERVSELIERVKKMTDNKFLVSTSFAGNRVPTSNIIQSSDFVLIHGNGIEEPEGIKVLVEKVRASEGYYTKPILFNEDDHFDFDKESYNLKTSIESYASWGFFDFRKEGEPFESGFQSIPTDWKISSERKKAFFYKLKEITGY